ncbi:DMT family transporter [Flavonifractor plautii]|nr:DMT family transporter [Flavonifractor plautii]
MTEHKESSVLARFASPLLILATIIWGSSFVVMKSSVDVLPTFWLLAIRFSFAALVLAVVFIRRWKVLDKQYLIGGTVMGFCLFLAYTFQTFGLEQTTSGKNAFFTAVYCVIVPFLYWFIAKRRPDRFNLIAAFLCIGGSPWCPSPGTTPPPSTWAMCSPSSAASSSPPTSWPCPGTPRDGTSSSSPPSSLPPSPSFPGWGTDHPPGADARRI